MRLSADAHLTYCTNIHPGERWAEVRDNLARHVLEVKRRVCPDVPFGVGLRLSARAAEELCAGDELARLRDFLGEHGLYVFTLNGFPHGAFHGEAVKERVYLPDWRDPARLAYSNRLAEILAALLPVGVEGSVSSVPGAYAAEVRGEADVAAMVQHLVDHAAWLVQLEERTGKRIALALEPEPCCHLETVAQAVAFFRDHLYGAVAGRRLARATGLTAPAVSLALRRHLGLCLDACHAAVEFEDPEAAVADLRAAGIAVHKLQLSAGLRVAPLDASALDALDAYADPVYLHQVVARRGDALVRYADLPEALADARRGAVSDEWRVHFHVPVFLERLAAFDNTQAFLRALLALHRQEPISRHLEVETYTWQVLPPEARGDDVNADVARELRWVLSELAR